MTNTLYIPIADGTTSLNGLIALFINNWSGSKTQLAFVDQPSESDVFHIFIQSSLPPTVDCDPALLTTLPFLVVAERDDVSRLTVSGLAAVSRHVIKESNDPKVHKSLGFRGSCLQAPAECSIWTSFCEVQMIQSTTRFLKQPVADTIEIPSSLVKLEKHLKQPIRMHNIVKRWQDEEPQPLVHLDEPKQEIQKLAAIRLNHAYAEGPDMTLADLLLFPCVMLLADRLLALGITLGDHLPQVCRWLVAMKALVGQAWNTTVNEQPLDMSFLSIRTQPSVKVPDVKEASLYKKDSSRAGLGNLKSEEATRVVDLLKEQMLWLEENEDKTGLVAKLPSSMINNIDITTCIEFTSRIDWSSLPDPVHPRQGHVPGN